MASKLPPLPILISDKIGALLSDARLSLLSCRSSSARCRGSSVSTGPPRTRGGLLRRRSFPMLAPSSLEPPASLLALQAAFLNEVLPRIETHAQVCFRGVRCHPQ